MPNSTLTIGQEDRTAEREFNITRAMYFVHGAGTILLFVLLYEHWRGWAILYPWFSFGVLVVFTSRASQWMRGQARLEAYEFFHFLKRWALAIASVYLGALAAVIYLWNFDEKFYRGWTSHTTFLHVILAGMVALIVFYHVMAIFLWWEARKHTR